MLHVERQALLRAVGPDEVRRESTHAFVVAPSEIAAARSLDLDDARAEIGELTGAERTRNRVLQRDNGNPFEWEDSSRLRAASALGRRCCAHRWTPTLAASVANAAAALPPEGE